jgi:hypothetical protein
VGLGRGVQHAPKHVIFLRLIGIRHGR